MPSHSRFDACIQLKSRNLEIYGQIKEEKFVHATSADILSRNARSRELEGLM